MSVCSATQESRLCLPASICRGHHDELLLPLGIKQFPDPLQHLVGERNGECELQRVAAQVVIPLCLLVRVQATNENIIYDILATLDPLQILSWGAACGRREALCSKPIRRIRTIISCHRPCSKLLIGVLGVEVGLLPNSEEDLLGKHIGCREGLACVEDGDGGSGFDSSHGEGRLQTVLINLIRPDDVVVPLVELLLVRPCNVSAISFEESGAMHLI